MLTYDEKAKLKCDVCLALHDSVRKATGHAVSALVDMLTSIHEGRVDRAGGPSKCVFVELRGADNLRLIDRWVSEEFPGQYPLGTNRITELFTVSAPGEP